MGKVYFDSDSNVCVEGKPETYDFNYHSLWVYPDGRCLFKGCTSEALCEVNKTPIGSPEHEKARKRWSDWRLSSANPDESAPEEVIVFPFVRERMTQEDRRLFFDANKGLLQKIVDSGIVPKSERKSDWERQYDNHCRTDEGRDAANIVGTHAECFSPGELYFNVWFERFPGKHLCGLTQEDYLAFAEVNNLACDSHEAEYMLCKIDRLMGAGVEPDSNFPPPIERVGLSADKKHIFVQLSKPFFEEQSIDDSYGKRKVDRYHKYTAIGLLTQLLPAIDSTFSADRAPVFKDPSGKIPGTSFNDLNCKVNEALFSSRESVATQVSKMLRCFNGMEILDDFIREFPEEAFPDFPAVPHEKYLPDSAFKPDESAWYWNSSEAESARDKLIEHLENYAPKGIMFSTRSKNPELFFHPVAEMEYGFWNANAYGWQQADFLYDQVASGEHPAFKYGNPDKNGKVKVCVPKTGWANGSDMCPVTMFHAAALCAVYDPERDKNRFPKDFILQENPRMNEMPECINAIFFEKSNYSSEHELRAYPHPVTFVSVPSDMHRKCIPAMSSDPVDYMARYCLAAKAGCNLSTTQEVVDGAKKKLAGWLGKHFCACEYDKLVSLNKKVEKREKEIIAEMKQKHEERKKESAEKERDDACLDIC